MDSIQKQKDVALVTSILVYICIAAMLYYTFLLVGIDHAKALVESIVVSTTLITLVILYLFGKIWKKELDSNTKSK